MDSSRSCRGATAQAAYAVRMRGQRSRSRSSCGTAYVTAYVTADVSGCSPEMLALCWSDIDLDDGVLRVRRTLGRIDGLGLVESEPKTAQSRRTLMLSRGWSRR
jgi:integrase